MAMNLDAIRPRKAEAERQAEERIAQQNRSAANGNFLYRDTMPALEAIAKGLKAEAAVQPVAPTGNLAAAIKAMTAGVEKTTAAIVAPAAAAPAPVVPAQAQRSTGNPLLVPMMTESQHRRKTEAREQARKTAAKAEADRVMVRKAGPRVLTFRKLDATLSDAAVFALNHIVNAWEANGRRPVPINAPDLSRALGISMTAAQAAYTSLIEKRLIISANNSLGTHQVLPGLAVTGA